MSTNNFTTRTASLRATKIDTSKITLKGKNILDYISESKTKVLDERGEFVTEQDLWGTTVTTDENGVVHVSHKFLSNPNSSSRSAWLSNVKAVQDNKVYSEITTDGEGNFSGVVEDSVIANVQTEMIKDGSFMFYNTSLASFNADLNSLVDGQIMFAMTPLTSFNGDLSSLVNGSWMFYGTGLLTSFTSNLSSLVNGQSMFYQSSLESFIGDLRSLVNGKNMFEETPLTLFNGDLSSLVNGSNMFYNTPLKSFNGDLSSLVNGQQMFRICKLSPQSVMYIVESIRNITEEKAKYPNGETGETGEIPWVTYDSTTRKYSAPFGFMENGNYVYTYNTPNPHTTIISSTYVGQLTLGIDVTNDAETIEQQLQTFAEGCLCDSWAELKQEFVDKGWTVTFQYGGDTTQITLSEDEQFRGVPVYARLIEVSDEDKDKAEYCTEDGTKFYNINWGHDVTDYDAYQYFGSLLEACGYYGVIPVKYLEEN